MEKFLWRNSKEKNKIHLIRWKIITLHKDKGSLGINNVKDTNYAFFCKWLWRFLYETNPLWKRIILAKYDQSFIGDVPTNEKFSSLKAPWRSIIKCIDWFIPYIKWKIKNKGFTFSFWHGNWHEHSPISLQSPRLYALATKK